MKRNNERKKVQLRIIMMKKLKRKALKESKKKERNEVSRVINKENVRYCC